ncbi:hypothetical protein Asch01_03096 [Acinetobacter schindleri]|jgi:hypothetical protein|uniref:hypothetical protein n=1 Tax=Acinetobacter schindleri TaxID=108981 RepID=UPI0030ADB5DA
MFDFQLPLGEEFLEILNFCEIVDWEAKDFWNMLETSGLVYHERKKLRTQTYASLQLLRKHGYLTVESAAYRKQLFLYSQTEKLINMRKTPAKKNKVTILVSYKEELQLKTNELISQIEYSAELLVSLPELEKEIINFRNSLEHQLKKHQVETNTLNRLLEFI